MIIKKLTGRLCDCDSRGRTHSAIVVIHNGFTVRKDDPGSREMAGKRFDVAPPAMRDRNGAEPDPTPQRILALFRNSGVRTNGHIAVIGHVAGADAIPSPAQTGDPETCR